MRTRVVLGFVPAIFPYDAENRVGPKGVGAIANAMKLNSTIQVLEIRCVPGFGMRTVVCLYISCKQAFLLAYALCVRLFRSSVCRDYVEVCTCSLYPRDSVADLTVAASAANGIRAGGADAISGMMKFNSCITELVLCGARGAQRRLSAPSNVPIVSRKHNGRCRRTAHC